MRYIEELTERYPILESCKEDIIACCKALIKSYENGGKVLICGNGGSCADAEHITGELMKGFLKKRPISEKKKADMLANYPELDLRVLDALQQGLPTIPLNGAAALNTAFANDCNSDYIYAQQVLGYGKAGDAFIGISTSGNAENVCAAAETAKALGLTSIALAGRDGGKLKRICDIAIVAHEAETFKIQELHLPIYHAICAEVEEYFFKE